QLSAGVVRCHATLRVDSWPTWLVSEVLEDPALDDPDEDGWQEQLLAVIWHHNELRAAAVDPDTAAMLDAISQGQPIGAWLDDDRLEALEPLLEGGFIVWLPPARSGDAG